MYRMGKLEDAQTILDRADPSDRPADYALLQSQILYRQGKFSEAAASFEGVLKTHLKSLEHPSDVRSNVIAAYVSGGRAEQVGKVLENLKISATGAGFEAAFNVACGLLESGRHDEAGVQLEVAARLGREQLMEDDLEEDEIEVTEETFKHSLPSPNSPPKKRSPSQKQCLRKLTDFNCFNFSVCFL